MNLSRRHFLRTAGAVSIGFAGLRKLHSSRRTGAASPKWEALGELVPDPAGIVDLPEGFGYSVFSIAGEEMDDGFLVPQRHDGMAAFAGPDGTTVLVRNHENVPGIGGGAFGDQNELLSRLDPKKAYDLGRGQMPALGGTTTLVYDTKEQYLVEHHLSLAGTIFNCCGGPMPWGSWVSCEETTTVAGDVMEKDHGFCFEVPALHEGLVDPVPLTAMGRFQREAVACHPSSGVIYMTEDQADSLFYRFVPDSPGDLRAGGKVQALVVRDATSLDTRNWNDLTNVPVGKALDVAWIDMDDVLAPNDDLRMRGFAAGAARFARGEGIWYGHGAAYFNCTSGGPSRLGQVWRYTPSPEEGTAGEEEAPGQLELYLEPDDPAVLENNDNLTVTPWGGLILCEDGGAEDHLVGVTPGGEMYLFARNAHSQGEFAGATFSPDETTLFVNMQEDGFTLAITGPWEKVRAI